MKSWLKQVKWFVWLLVACVIGVAFIFIGPFVLPKDRRVRKPDGTTSADPLPMLPAAVQASLDRVHEEAVAAKVEASVRSEEQRKQLADIQQIDDGVERRRRLAALARTL